VSQRRYILSLSCPDRVGLVAAVSGFLAENQGWIVEAAYHATSDSLRFFMRQEVLASSLPFDLPELRRRFAPIAERFRMTWRLSDTAHRHRVALLVSREDHCLYDLLHRHASREFDFELAAVVSNHELLRPIVEFHGIPFHHVPVPPDGKEEAFRRVAGLVQEARADSVVLARYMQVLPPWFCAEWSGRLLNIHHSFLPSFVGAKPYHQAYARGVKLIGATCHYVTAELDQGPILEQDSLRVDHGDTVEDLIRSGKDIEKNVLARGLRWHVEDRVLIDGQKTVVFR
jgi:formyltetrahydrofolate deformylase